MTPAIWWRGMADGSRRGLPELMVVLLLALPTLVYGLIMRLRALLYRLGIFTSYRLPCPVISIGNLTVGGTGKTPAVILISRLLMQRGCRVAVLSRGYGGSLEGQVALVSNGASLLLTPQQAGDEPCLLARSLPGVGVVIGADRHKAGLLALEHLKPDIVLLDDGFQHIRLQRDLNILLLDATRPFGNGWTLPLGLLREPVSALNRADLVIFTRWRPGQPIADLGVPYCCSEHRLNGFYCLESGEQLQREQLQQGRVAAFAGIADPAAFFEGLQQLGITPVATLALPDHADYGAKQLALLDDCVAQSEPDWLLTTEKDGVKLLAVKRSWRNRVVAVRLTLQLSDEHHLFTALDAMCDRGGKESITNGKTTDI